VVSDWYCAAIAFIAVFLVLPTWIKLEWRERRARRERDRAIAEGRHEPVTIVPHVDASVCMGSGACVKACPEHVLQVVDGQMAVVNAAACVGHGACVAACPVEAIELVFGSERRGIDIPVVRPDFQSDVPGLYIAGELGGMGLIANSVDQGRQAMDQIAATLPRSSGDTLDVVVVGVGPAGLSAGLRAHEKGLRYALLDQDELGGAIRHYPRQKLVMTRPMELPGYGRVQMTSARKEELVELFEKVVAKTGLKVDAPERVEAVSPQPDGTFVVRTSKRTLTASRVLLAIGRRGTPRKLGVPGEDQEKVAYRLIDPELYEDQHVLVVGAGDSAVEAAVSLGEQPGNRVTLSYRGKVIDRPKKANLERLAAAEAAGKVTVLLESGVVRIDVDRVELEQRGERVVIPNDFVFVFAGGVLPTAFLEAAGIGIRTHYGKRVVSKL
jgi:thioredoxin reductase (NADPH)